MCLEHVSVRLQGTCAIAKDSSAVIAAHGFCMCLLHVPVRPQIVCNIAEDSRATHAAHGRAQCCWKPLLQGFQGHVGLAA